MTLLTPIVHAFRSELLKCRRWSMFAGTGIMLVASAFFAYLTFHQITSGVTGQEVDPLAHAFSTELGLITVVGQARSSPPWSWLAVGSDSSWLARFSRSC